MAAEPHPLTAILATSTAEFVTSVARAWEAGEAVLPLDPHLDIAAATDLVNRLGASRLIDTAQRAHPGPGGATIAQHDRVVLLTSGTSGHPKPVVLSESHLRCALRQSTAALGIDVNYPWLGALPTFHIAGFAMVARSILFDTPVRWSAIRGPLAWETIQDRPAISVVPAMLDQLEYDRLGPVLVGGSLLPRDLPSQCVRSYGLTESCGGVVFDGIPGAETEVQVSTQGRIGLRGASIAERLLDGARIVDDEGWLWTQDIGTLNDRLEVHGRADDCIISGGENIWPQPIEALIGSLQGVDDVAVLGIPHARWGHAVNALVVTNRNLEDLSHEIRELVTRSLGPWHVPKRLRRVERIPRTTLGKIRRSVLAGLYEFGSLE